MPSYPKRKATRRRQAAKRRSRVATKGTSSETLSLLENTQRPSVDTAPGLQAEEPSQHPNDPPLPPPWSAQKCNCLDQSSICQLQECQGQTQVQKVRLTSRPCLKAWSDQSQDQVRHEKAQATAHGEGNRVEPPSVPTFDFEIRRPATMSCTGQPQVNPSSTTPPKQFLTGSASPLSVYSMKVPRLDTVMVQLPAGSSGSPTADQSALTPVQAPMTNSKEVEGERFITKSLRDEGSPTAQAVSMAYSRSLYTHPGFQAGRALTPDVRHASSQSSALDPNHFIPHQSFSSSLQDVTAPLYANNFRPVWPPGTLPKKTIPLPRPTQAITHAWTNGLPLPLSTDAAEQTPANATPFISDRTYSKFNRVALPVTSPATSQATPADHPAMIVSKPPSRSLVNQRYNPAHEAFKRAMQAEEARLAEKRSKEIKTHPLGLKTTSGLGHGTEEVSRKMLPPGIVMAKPSEEPPRTSPAHTASAAETKTVLVENGDGWDGETLRDDDWEFVEWPPLSALLWRASGLDGLVLGMEED